MMADSTHEAHNDGGLYRAYLYTSKNRSEWRPKGKPKGSAASKDKVIPDPPVISVEVRIRLCRNELFNDFKLGQKKEYVFK